MTSRERVRKSINHQISDRIPIDLGATNISTIHVIALDKLRKYLKLDERPPKALDPLLWIGDVEEDLREALQIDCIGVRGLNNSLGLKNDEYKRMKVYEETRRNAEILSKGGGYVGGNVHNVQYDVPPENLIAELQALRDTTPYV